MRVKTLTTENELEEYSEVLFQLTLVRLPTEYLRQGLVRGLVSREGRIVGGYAIIMEGPFRCVRLLPSDKQKMLGSLMLDGAVAEATGLFLSPVVRSPYVSMWLGFHILLDLISSRRKFFIFGYNFDIEGLRRMYAKMGGEVLFRGKPESQGLKSHAILSLELLGLRSVLFNIPRHLISYGFRRRSRGISLRDKVASS